MIPEEPPVAWEARWAVDKASLRSDVKAFEERIRHLGITPPISSSSRRNSTTTEEIPRHDMSQEPQQGQQGQQDPNNFNNTGFSEQQWRSLQSLLRGGPDDRPPPGGPGPAPQAEAPARPLPLRPDDIGFFNPGADGDGPVVGEKHVTFRDVFVFVDRLKEMKRRFNEEQVLKVILSCLKGTAITWHTAELSEFERVVLETANLDQWIKLLIRRFKENTGEAVKLMYSEKFTMSDALNNADPRDFAQSIFRHARAAELGDAQLIVTWNNLAPSFRNAIPQPTTNTSVHTFLEQLDAKRHIWHELAVEEDKTTRRVVNKAVSKGGQSGQYTASRPGGFSKPPYSSVPFQRSDQQQPYQGYSNNYGGGGNYNNSNYQANRPQYPSQSQYSPRGSLPAPRQPLQIAGGPANRSNSPRPSYQSRPFQGQKSPAVRPYQNNFSNKGRNDFQQRSARVYHGNENNDEPNSYSPTEDSEEPQDFEYYDDEPPEEHFEPEEETHSFFVGPVDKTCRRCKKTFASRNKLYQHLRDEHRDNEHRSSDQSAAKVHVPPVSEIHHAASEEPNSSPRIVQSKVDHTERVAGAGFRNWHHVTAKVQCSREGLPQEICLDTGCPVTLGDRRFLQTHMPHAELKTMESPSTVKGIGEARHSIVEYVRVPLLLPGRSDIGEPVLAEITVDVHLVDDLRANMLIGMDTIGPEGINIITTKRHAYVTSCSMRILVKIKPQGARVRRAVKAKNDVLVRPGEQITIPVNYHAQLPDRDLLFEPDEFELTLYAHIIDASVDSILARNESSTPISISKKTRLGYITKIPYDNCYLATPEVADLAARPPKKTRQLGWTRQVLKAATAYLATASMGTAVKTKAVQTDLETPAETLLPNGVTMHGPAQGPATVRLAEVVTAYPKLWEDSGFVDIPQDQWMRIPLKPGWEDKVDGSAKTYPVGEKDRKVIDKTFDELHDQGRLEWTTESTPFSYPIFVVWRTLPNGERKGRAVVDIRKLNEITQPDAYPLPLQSDIIATVSGCQYITVIDYASFFYQWRVWPEHRHRLIVITHRGQETFRVPVIGYKGSIAYVQREIDRVLRPYRDFARAYVDDVVIASKTLNEHVEHLHKVFALFLQKGISIKLMKSYVGYPSIKLLG